MPQVINTNVQSLNAQRNLNVSGQSLATTLQRLSSGLRINSAKDDAAGLAISDRFSTQIRGLNQAVRNSNDGISLSQTGEGALAEITTNLQRIRELAVQSANATNSASDRAALDLEVKQRIAEVERIASQTAFNGQRILDGTFGSAAFQTGANAGEVIKVDLATSVRSASIGQIAYGRATDQANAEALVAGVQATIGSNQAVTLGGSVNGALTRQTADSAYAKALAFAGVPGLEVAAVTNVAVDIADIAATNNAGDTYDLRLNGVDIFAGLDIATTGITGRQIADAINNQTANTGVTASLDAHPDNAGSPVLLLSAADGRNIVIGQTTDAATGGVSSLATDLGPNAEGYADFGGVRYFDGVVGTTAQVFLGKLSATVDATTGVVTTYESDGTTAFDESAATNRGFLTFSSSQNISFNTTNSDTGGAAAAIGFTNVTIGTDTFVNIGRDVGSLAQVSVGSVLLANDAIRRIDSALTSVSNLRSTFGAIQNRFESTINNLQTTSENLAASRSRILDADFAAETAELTRTQILQQAGVAILAQANQIPQNVLSLLR